MPGPCHTGVSLMTSKILTILIAIARLRMNLRCAKKSLAVREQTPEINNAAVAGFDFKKFRLKFSENIGISPWHA